MDIEKMEKRREKLETKKNPASDTDYVITFSKHYSDNKNLIISYVPDRSIVEDKSLEKYFDELDKDMWDSEEEKISAVMDDMNNELIPRWIKIEQTEKTQTVTKIINMQDRQPEWNNERLLSFFKG